MLTHVIFAFVKMNADGTLELGAVGAGEENNAAKEVAEKRLNQLKVGH